MLAGIAAREQRQAERMRASRIRLGLRFPRELDPAMAVAALDGLSGVPSSAEIVFEVIAREGAISHALWVPAAHRSSAESALGGVIRSLRITEASDVACDSAVLSLRLFVPTPCVLSGDGAAAASDALLAGLAALRSGEELAVRWALRPGNPRRWQPRDGAQASEVDGAWRRKLGLSGFSVGGLVVVRASKARARELCTLIESVLRARRGITEGVRATRGGGGRRLNAMPRTSRTSGWLSTAELLPLLAWPVGPEAAANVEVGSRELRAPQGLPRQGRRLFIARDVHGERPVALDAVAARHHVAIAGSSGSGKSVLLARCVLDDIAGGFAGAVIDPKADLVSAILDRVPAEHIDRIVVLDPGDIVRPLPGVAMLSGGDADARADVLTATLKSIFGSAWGLRSDHYGRLAIRTLSEVPGASLADMGRLFYEAPFRRAAIARLRDPFLVSAWQSFEALSPAAQAEHIQAPMARVMTLLSRPRVRAVLANPDPKLDVAQLFAERRWLLVSLAPGAMSEAGATFVGAALMYVIWSAIEARVSLAPERRHPVFLYVDELATLTNGLPFGFELLAERARGLGAGLTVAFQTLSRIGEPTRSALLGNVATFIAFRAGALEASRIARQLPGLSEGDVMALGAFEVGARVASGPGGAVSVVTGHTEPLPPPTGHAKAIRDRSAERYASPPREQAEPAVPESPHGDGEGPLGRVRRAK
jgi:hypothetical protein